MEFNVTTLANMITTNFSAVNSTRSAEVIQVTNPRDSRPSLTSLEQQSLSDYYFAINGVCYTFICSIGIVSNLLNIIMLYLALKRRNFVTHKLFLCMACADLWTMIVVLSYAVSFNLFGVIFTFGHPPDLDVTYARYFWLKTWYHFANISIMISNWMAVLLGLFRLLAVSFPLRAQTLSSSVRVNASIVVVIVVTILLNIPHWLARRVDEYGAFRSVYDLIPFGIITALFVTPIPIFLCLIVTIALIAMLLRRRRSMEHTIQKNQADAREREQRQITTTLIVIAIFYIVTNMPSMVYWIIAQQRWWDDLGISRYRENWFYLSTQLIQFIGYASNFFIYITGNASFRADLVQLVRVEKIRKWSIKSSKTSSTNVPKSSASTSASNQTSST